MLFDALHLSLNLQFQSEESQRMSAYGHEMEREFSTQSMITGDGSGIKSLSSFLVVIFSYFMTNHIREISEHDELSKVLLKKFIKLSFL